MRRTFGARSVATWWASCLLAGSLLATVSDRPAAGQTAAQTPPTQDEAPPTQDEARYVSDRDIYRLRGEAEARRQVQLRRPRAAQYYRGKDTVLGALSSPRVERTRASVDRRRTESFRRGRPEPAEPAPARIDEGGALGEASGHSLWWIGVIPPVVIVVVLAALVRFGPSPPRRRRTR